jgi:hypothetical protein
MRESMRWRAMFRFWKAMRPSPAVAEQEIMMRYLSILTAAALVAATASAGGSGLSPAVLSPAASDLSALQLVQEKRKSDTITQRVKRAWKDLVGYKFDVFCPIIFPIAHRTCTETGENRNDARSKCASRNPFCYVSDAN